MGNLGELSSIHFRELSADDRQWIGRAGFGASLDGMVTPPTLWFLAVLTLPCSSGPTVMILATLARSLTRLILEPKHPLRLSRTVTLATTTYWSVDVAISFLFR